MDHECILYQLREHIVRHCLTELRLHCAQACFLLLCGRLADLYGRKLLWIIGYFITGVCGLGSCFAQCVSDRPHRHLSPFFYLTVFKRVAEMALDIMRGIQGIGAAAMIPASVSLFLSCRSAHSEMRYDSSAWHSVEGIPSWTLAFHRLCNLFRGRSNRISLLHCSRQRSHTVN